MTQFIILKSAIFYAGESKCWRTLNAVQRFINI